VKLLKNRKGQIRVIEAFFASVLILSSLSLIPLSQKFDSRVDGQANVLSSVAYRTLVSLDAEGQLAELVANRNWSALKGLLQSCFSPAVWFNVTVFDQNLVCLNDVFICNGGLVADRVYSADYICARANASYAVYLIRLQLAVVN
jgi:hypothetical protein